MYMASVSAGSRALASYHPNDGPKYGPKNPLGVKYAFSVCKQDCGDCCILHTGYTFLV